MKTLRELSDMRGRVALITGGAGHVGLAAGEALAELGCKLVLLDNRKQACESAAKSLSNKFRVEVHPLNLDLTRERSLRSVPAGILKRLGRIDVLIHCAALVGTTPLKGWTVPFEQQRSDTWRLALEVNLTSAFVLTQSCAGALRRSGHGTVINISSIYGMVGPDMSLYQGLPMGHAAAYAAGKGGLLQLTRWLATTLAPKIRVNAITLGGILRQQPKVFQRRYRQRTPLGRMGTEEDLKGAVAYLASDLSNYVTGHNLVLDGGWTAW